MVLEGTGRYAIYERSRQIVYVPPAVAYDSTFPLKPGEPILVRIDNRGKRVILEPALKGGSRRA